MRNFGHPKWGFIINPLDNLLQTFAETAQSPDFIIWRTQPGFVSTTHVWASAHFDDASHVNELADRAAAFKAVFDGAMYVVFGANYQPPIFRSLIDNHSQRTHSFPQGRVQAEPFSPLRLSTRIPRMFNPMRRFGAEQLVFLARFDAVAKAMLKHLGFNGPDFRTLYALLDWMEANGWSDPRKIAAAAGLAKGEVTRFTPTANNVEVLGPFARHGERSVDPPANPMTLEEAQHLILSATASFLGEQSTINGLREKWEFHYVEHDG
jgi:hypothetical protein